MIAELNQFVDAAAVAMSIAKQVRQPLTSIVASASAIQRWLDGAGPLPGNVSGALDRIVTEGHRANEMLVNFLRDLNHSAQ